ncbi:porin [Echinicola sp. 20G]|uniref:porin n=1 Tax=Echinicola sp. 20G TaxID=2781961 RepID=UPI00190FE607|nr:porin [Echinicola sp. 20G]
MKTRLLFFLLALGVFSNLKAQSNEDSLTLSIRPYGSFRGHFSVYNGELELQENASRIGFELSVAKGNSVFFAGSELSLNMFKGDQSFNLDASTSGGFIDVENNQTNQVFGTRLGYLGVEINQVGTITIGKQWGVYYDITGYTDKFNVFGGNGTSTYTAGTDGGTTGTGRADQAITYRNQFGRLAIGLQFQAENAYNDHFIDGYGLSGQFEILSGLKVGGTYYTLMMQDTLKENTLGFGNDPQYMAFGISYVNHSWDFGLVYSKQSNGDFRRSYINEDLAAVVFDAKGIEVFSKYTFNPFSITIGYNQYIPKITGLPLNEFFKTEYFILGFEYKPLRHAFFYSETRFNTSNNRDHFGEKNFNVLTLGIRIDLERTLSQVR